MVVKQFNKSGGITVQIVILAGGRFWQFLKLFGDKSLIRQTYERLADEVKPEDVFIITSAQTKERTVKELPEIPIENIFGEPFRRNTAPACFTGTLMAKKGSTILVLPADHRIEDKRAFWEYVRAAEKACNTHNGLYTFGIKPTRAETGYGYIEAGEKVDEQVFEVKKFHEKPELSKALEYTATDNFFWNSGMFIWKREYFIEEMRVHAPQIHQALANMDIHNKKDVLRCYEGVPAVSIDYALMEKSETVKTLPISLNWSDVGSWESIKELEGPSKTGTNTCLIDSDNVYVRSETGKNIAVVGVKNLIVVETKDGILICEDKQTQKVREVVRKLNKA